MENNLDGLEVDNIFKWVEELDEEI